jgi:hypothetical protein
MEDLSTSPINSNSTDSYILEITTRSGKICERFRSFERARRRLARLNDQELIGIPLIFKELPDGSQRLVREDGKPLQWHRAPERGDEPVDDRPLPLVDS